MRRGTFLIAIPLLAPLAVFSCAEDAGVTLQSPPTSEADAGPTVLSPDASDDVVESADATDEDVVGAPLPECSNAGLCVTTVPAGLTLRAVWGAGDGVVWAVATEGDNDEQAQVKPGTILRWDGAAWTAAFTTSKGLNTIWGASADDLWVGGYEGMFHGVRAASGQIVWTADPSSPSKSVSSIWCRDAAETWAVIDGALYARSSESGGAWTLDTTVPTLNFQHHYDRVWGSPTTIYLAGGYTEIEEQEGAKIFWRSTVDGRVAWVPILRRRDLQPSISAGAFVPPSTIYALSTHGGVPIYYNDTTIFQNRFVVGRIDANKDYTLDHVSLGGTDHLRAVWGGSENDVWLAGSYGQVRHWDGLGFTTMITTLEGLKIQGGIVQNGFYGIWGDATGELWIVGNEVALHRKAGT